MTDRGTRFGEERVIKLTPENFLNERRNVENGIEEKYGRLGTAIVTGKEFTWKYETVGVNATEAKKKEVNDNNNIVRQMKKDYDENKSKAMATLKKHLSDIALSRVENHPQFKTITENGDPVKFWIIIQEVLKKSGGNDEVQMTLELNKLSNLKQSKGEKIEGFSAKFEKQVKVCQQLGMKFEKESGEHVRLFIKNIDQSRYKYFFEKLYDKPLQERTMEWVRALAIEAESREILEEQRLKLGNSKESSNEKSQEPNMAAMTKHLPPNKGGKKYNKNNRKREQNAEEEEGENQSKRTKQREKRFCHKCKNANRPSVVYESHNTDKCRSNYNNQNNQQQRNGKQNSSYLNIAETQPETEEAIVQGFGFMVQANLPHDPNWLILDNACTIHTFNKKAKLLNVRKGNACLTSIHAKNKKESLIGEHQDFGEGVVVPEAPVSLISMDKAREIFDVRYDHDHCFYLWNRTGGKNFIAKPRASLHVLEVLEDHDAVYYNITNMTGPERAIKLHEALDHPYTPYLIKAIKAGFFKDWKVTDRDINQANLGVCHGCEMGKDGSRRIRNEDDNVEMKTGRDIHVDIIYLNGKPKRTMYLLSVEEVTGFINLYKMTTKNPEELQQAILAVVGYLKSHGHTVQVIHADRESSLATIESRLNIEGYRIVQVAPNVHEKIAERTVRSIRNRWRATYYGLKYKLPTALFPYLLFHVVSSMNSTPNVKTGSDTPRGIITNQARTSLTRFPFGTVGYFKEPQPSGSNQPRRRLGIYIGKEAESRAVKAFMLDNKKFVMRDDFFPVEITAEVREYINELTAQDVMVEETIIESESYKLASENSDAVADDAGRTSLPSDEEMNDKRDADILQGVLRAGSDASESSLELTSEKSPEPATGQLDSSRDPPITPLHGNGGMGAPIPTAIVPASSGGQSVHRKGTVAIDHGPFKDRGNVTSGNRVDNANPGGRIGWAASFAPPITASVGNSKESGSVGEGQWSSLSGGDGVGKNPTDPAIATADSPDRANNGNCRGGAEKTVEEPSPRDQQSPEVKISGVHDRAKRRRVTFPSELNVGGVEESRDYITRTGRDTRNYNYKRLGTIGKAMNTTSSFVGVADGSLEEERGNNVNKVAEAISAELKQMLEYKVWTPIKRDMLPQSVKVIPSTMFTIEKYGPNGEYVKHKSRLVAGGHKEWIPSSYDTSSPTVQLETIFLALNIAATEKLGIDTMDVGGAFLEAKLNRDDVFIELDKTNTSLLVKIDSEYAPFVEPNGRLVVKLNKAMYGLKEASMEWYKHLVRVLKEFGFQECKHDSATMIKKRDHKIEHLILLHVDDMLSIGTERSRDQLIDFMRRKFKKLTVSRDTKFQQYVGLVIEREAEDSILLSQPGHVKQIMTSFALEPETTSVLPCDSKLFMEEKNDELIPDPKLYRSQVMKLMYLTRTRPDIKLPVTYLSTKMQEPRKSDYIKLYKVAKYINLTRGYKMRFQASNMQLRSSADASHAVHMDGKGHSGFCMWLGTANAAISVVSKKQGLVSGSSTESEMIALSEAGKRVVWTRDFLQELGYEQQVTIIEQDNQSSVTLSNKGPGRAGQSKSIRVRNFWITNEILEGSIRLEYVPSEEILADGYTKPLGGERFTNWRDRVLNMQSM